MSSEDVDQELDRLDNNLNGLWEGRIPELEERINQLEKRINDLDGRVRPIEMAMAEPVREPEEESGSSTESE